jgi:hypothetical protein
MILQMEFELCVAAGIDASKLSPIEVFLLAGKIIHDRTIPHDARIETLRAMTPAERQALRVRIGATPQGPHRNVEVR